MVPYLPLPELERRARERAAGEGTEQRWRAAAMNRNLLVAAGVVAAVVLVLAMSALFTVHQTQQALVLQFGNPKRVVQEPGLHVKLPFIQNAVYIDRRVLDFDAEAQEVILGDQKRLVVDAFARYKIVDPLRFYQSVGTEARAARPDRHHPRRLAAQGRWARCRCSRCCRPTAPR